LGPTLADLAGTAMPWADGVSFATVIAGGNVGRDYMIQDHPLGGYTAGPWRLPWWGILTPKWHYLKIGTRPGVLYNVINDPWEQTVLYNRTVKQRLKSYWPY
jgi:arylsulfatase A-like enzyme